MLHALASAVVQIVALRSSFCTHSGMTLESERYEQTMLFVRTILVQYKLKLNVALDYLLQPQTHIMLK